MALRDQPFIPLYVKDVKTDEKLIECSASAHGVYFLLICILHKQQEYGTITLKDSEQKFPDPIKNFALKLNKSMPFGLGVIEAGIKELSDWEVIAITGNKLSQKRMVADNETSRGKSDGGKKGAATRWGKKDNIPIGTVITKSMGSTAIANANAFGNGFKEGGAGETIKGMTEAESRNFNQAMNDTLWIEEICMKFGLDRVDCEKFLLDFLGNLKLDRELDKDYNDIRVHFRRWLNLELKKPKEKQDRNAMKPSIDMGIAYLKSKQS